MSCHPQGLEMIFRHFHTIHGLKYDLPEEQKRYFGAADNGKIKTYPVLISANILKHLKLVRIRSMMVHCTKWAHTAIQIV